MLSLLFIWAALFIGLILFAIDKYRMEGALTLAYFLSFSVIHVPGVLAYLNPDYVWGGVEPTKVGFEVTLIGMASFICGAIAARVIARRYEDINVSAKQRSLQKVICWIASAGA